LITLGLLLDRRFVQPLVAFHIFFFFRILGTDLCTFLANTRFEVVCFFIRLLLARGHFLLLLLNRLDVEWVLPVFWDELRLHSLIKNFFALRIRPRLKLALFLDLPLYFELF